MTVWRVHGFGGMVPAVDERLLSHEMAVYAENCLLKTGSIQPLPKPVALHTLSPSTLFAYRLPASYADANYLYNSTWMEFNHQDVSVVRAPVIDDKFDRYYWIVPGQPPKYNTRARIDAGQPPYLLGIPRPTQAPSVTPPVGTIETRSYVYTWVSAYDEEGPTSPPTTATGEVTGTWAITCYPPAAADTGPSGANRNITKLRIYRTVTTEDDDAVFFLVKELTLPTVTFNDTLTGAVISLNAQLESQDWTGPPSDLIGFILAPNGFLAGWRGNQFSELWFSEPYRPHAWPAKYTQVVEYPIVGLGITNQSVVCCTNAYPVTAQGIHPLNISMDKLVNHEPCLSRGSILSGPEGVFYASPNGLVLVSPGVAENVTRGTVSKRNWQQLLNVPRLRAARLGMSYFAYGTVQAGVFQDNSFQNDAFAMEDNTGAQAGVVLDPASDRTAFSMLNSTENIDNCYNDPWSGEVFLIENGQVKWMDIVSTNIPFQVEIWKSKTWQTGEIRNASACKVFFDALYGAPEGEIRFYVAIGREENEMLILTRPLTTSGELIRLPSGYKADFIRFEIEGKLRIHSVQFATTVKELAGA